MWRGIQSRMRLALAARAPTALAARCSSLLAAGALVAGCGGSTTSPTGPARSPSRPASRPTSPRPSGKTLDDLRRGRRPRGRSWRPASSLLHKGANRFGFALFDTRAQADHRRPGRALHRAPGRLRPARPVRRPRRVAGRQAAVREPHDGQRPRRRQAASTSPTCRSRKRQARRRRRSPSSTGACCARTPSASTSAPTGAQPPRRRRQGDPRPHADARRRRRRRRADRHARARRPGAAQDDFADVLGKKPVVLTFATPQLCQSRVCGPVVDVVEQVKRDRDQGRRLHPPGDLQGQRGQQGRARRRSRPGRLPTEPWTFVIDRNGRDHAPASRARSRVGELQRAVAKVA